MKRWISLLLLSAGLLLIAACGEGERTSTAPGDVDARDAPLPTLSEDIDLGPLFNAFSIKPELDGLIRRLLATGQYIHGLDPNEAIDALITLAPIHEERNLSFDALLGYLFLASIEGKSPQDATRTLQECLPSLPDDLSFDVHIRGFTREPELDPDLQKFKDLIDTTCD